MKKQLWLIAVLPLFALVTAQAQEIPTTERKADEPNARLELARAAKALVDKKLFGSEQNLDRERKLVADNAEALRLLRAALKLPFRGEALPETANEKALVKITSDNFSVLADYRYMARLLVTESRVSAADKNLAGAVRSGVDGQRLGVLVRSDGTLIQMMVGVAIEAIARRQLRELLPQLEATNAKTALKTWQSATIKSPTYAQTLRYEAAWNRISYEQLIRGVPQPIAQQMRAEWARLMEQEIAQSQVPYVISEQKARVDLMSEESIEGLGEEVPVPAALTAENANNLVARQFAVDKKLYRSARFLYENNRTQNALLVAEFALRAYELEHQKSATNWDDIVPAYLPQAPADPFDYEHSLRLTTRDGKTVAYSIGPDGLDDKGAPIDNGADAKWGRFRVDAGNRGDIVGGVNVQ